MLYVLSDMHIRNSEDPLYLSLLTLLRDRTGARDTVVLAGDIFDLFVGNKPVFLNRYSAFLDALKTAALKGVKLHYIEGNHDFLIKKAFKAVPELQVHPHDIALTIEGKKFFFAHGDTVDPTDYGYRALRMFFRSPVMKSLVRVLPGRWLDQIGQTSAKHSRASKPELPSSLPLGKMEKLRTLYRNFAAERLMQGHDFVVMGHCHDLDEMSFQIGDRTGQYINVGYPRVHGSFLSWTPGDARIQREKLPE